MEEENTNILSISIGTLIALAGAVLSYIGYIRAREKETIKRAEEFATIKSEIKALDKAYHELKEDVEKKDGKIEKRLESIDTKLEEFFKILIDLKK